MKHTDWVSNKGYEQHLNVLTNIYKRANKSSRVLRQSHFMQVSPTRPISPGTCKDSLTGREQKLLWDNYHLGKRIIETPPVISKRRFDQDYKKHQRLVHCLTASHRKGKPDVRVQSMSVFR